MCGGRRASTASLAAASYAQPRPNTVSSSRWSKGVCIHSATPSSQRCSGTHAPPVIHVFSTTKAKPRRSQRIISAMDGQPNSSPLIVEHRVGAADSSDALHECGCGGQLGRRGRLSKAMPSSYRRRQWAIVRACRAD